MRPIALSMALLVGALSSSASGHDWSGLDLLAQAGGPSGSSASAPTIRWIEIAQPGGVVLRAAVVWPEGEAPVPVVIVLHGTEGFSQDEVHLAGLFAAAGFLGVAGCWFAGPACPQGPPFMGATVDMTRTVRALITAAVGLPRARADGVALFGHSRGGMLALLAASTGSPAHAVVASSAQYAVADTGGKRHTALDVAPLSVVANLHVPVLILHATGDAISDVEGAREYERALRRLGKPVESHYYESGARYYTPRSHELTFSPETQDDVVRRSVRFLRQHLGL